VWFYSFDSAKEPGLQMDYATTITIVIALLIFAVALLYSTVGHGGASGYLAVMALFGLAPLVMKPTALVLNILVAIVGTIRFSSAGFFNWRLFWPFVVTSIPASFIGGSLTLPIPIYKTIVGVVLLYSAIKVFFEAAVADQKPTKTVPIWIALVLGAIIGLLSGLTGVGGGIFLSPIILMMHWAKAKQTSGVAIVFILVNSIAGLLGNIGSINVVHRGVLYWAPAALLGGWLGTELGTRVLPVASVRRWLSVVLGLAGLKLLWEVIVFLIQR
jgi:uncharacterized membrane protein YfcA